MLRERLVSDALNVSCSLKRNMGQNYIKCSMLLPICKALFSCRHEICRAQSSLLYFCAKPEDFHWFSSILPFLFSANSQISVSIYPVFV